MKKSLNVQNLSCVTSKILLQIDKLTRKRVNYADNPAQTSFASVTRPKNSSMIIPNKATVQKLEVKIDQVEQDALSKTIMVQGCIYLFHARKQFARYEVQHVWNKICYYK